MIINGITLNIEFFVINIIIIILLYYNFKFIKEKDDRHKELHEKRKILDNQKVLIGIILISIFVSLTIGYIFYLSILRNGIDTTFMERKGCEGYKNVVEIGDDIYCCTQTPLYEAIFDEFCFKK